MNGLYPPILPSSRPAHLYDDWDSYFINYKLPDYMDFETVGHALILITYLSNNSSAANTDSWPDGIIYVEKEEEYLTDSYVWFNFWDIVSKYGYGWEPGAIYKIQIRFGSTDLWDDFPLLNNFSSWKRELIENNTFSEWSNVMISKPIDYPDLRFLNAPEQPGPVVLSIKAPRSIETSTRPQFYVEYESEYELIYSYRFWLYHLNDTPDFVLLEDSGNIIFTQSASNIGQYTRNNMASYLSHKFKHLLQNGETYLALVNVVTVNGYVTDSESYIFKVLEEYIEPIEGLDIEAENTIFGSENGCILIYLTCGSSIDGIFVVSRTSELSNFEDYEDIKWLNFEDKTTVDHTLIMNDFTVESGVRYRYAILSVLYNEDEDDNGGEVVVKKSRSVSSASSSSGLDDAIRSTPILSNVVYTNFEYSYFYRDGVLLKLKFNNHISSFKYTVLRNKLDTLGSKYPYLALNGNAYYAEFPINGLISFHSDSDEQDWTFFHIGNDGVYYKDELIIPAIKFEDRSGQKRDEELADIDYTISMDLTHNNFYIERRFREKVEEFLNDFNYKLFKSPSEGNIVVALMNVQLTPKAELGRLVYEFSATAYEVFGHEFEDLINCGIEDTGKDNIIIEQEEEEEEEK